jgi:endonuclease/exonuclease/phosphatase family metal-dependent hydrolase
VVGNLNAHHEAWDSTLSDPRGDSISASIEISPLITLNDPDTPTRLPKSGAPTSLDVTLASAHVALASTWTTHVQLNSDHLPITDALPCEEALPPHTARSFINFRMADWPAFIR